MIRKQLLTYIIAAFVALAIFSVETFVALPVVGNLQESQSQLKQVAQEIEKQRGYLKHLKDQSNKIVLLEGYYDKAVQYLPEKANQNDLILQLDEAAKASEIAVSSLNLEDPQSDQVGFSLTAAGSYQAVVNFVKNLQTALRLITLSSVSLQAADEGAGLTIKGQAHFQPIGQGNKASQERLTSDVKILEELKHFGDPVKPEEFPGGSQEPFGKL